MNMQAPLHWKAIRPFKGSQNKGFEQLCFQLAMAMYGAEGRLIEVDDTGGGDGVEFYQEREGGKEWGWQAKFYDQSVRLSESGRKQKIIDSLKTALNNHPHLERWILCTNSQFTQKEQAWFDGTLAGYIPADRSVVLEHWSEGKIQTWLDKPEHGGIKHAFLGSLQLSPDWFQSKFEDVKHLVEEKYVHELHTKDHELYYYHLGPLLVNEDFRDKAEGNMGSINNVVKTFRADVVRLRLSLDNIIDWPVREEYFALIDKADQQIREILAAASSIQQSISPNGVYRLEQAPPEPPTDGLLATEEELYRVYRSYKPEWKADKKAQQDVDVLDELYREFDDTEHEKQELISFRNKVSSLPYQLRRIREEVGYFYRDTNNTKRRYLHLLGNAGIGKTHICTSLAREYLDAGLPAIFLPAIKFNEHQTLTAQILEILDIRSVYSFHDFLETLNTLGRAFNVRVPIIFDGLNESVNDRGMLNQIWKRDLRSLEQQVSRLSHVVLFTTCRRSYRKEIWEGDDSSHLHSYSGFQHQEDRKVLITRYFDKYGIMADLTYLSFSHFTHPLFLKIFCETKSVAGQQVYLQLGDDSIYEIFGQFLVKCDTTVYSRLRGYGYAPGNKIKKLASTVAAAIGKRLWEENTRLLTFESYLDLLNENSEGGYFESKGKALIDEGLLLVRDWNKSEEHIGFTYDLIAGYCIANYLIDVHQQGLASFITSQAFADKLITEDYQSRHPLAEDILECFIALLVPRTGTHLLDILPREASYTRIANQSFYALFRTSGKHIRPVDIGHVEAAFEAGNAYDRMTILEKAQEVFFVPSHPLNFLLFSGKLFRLSLPQKDLCWGEFLRGMDTGYLVGLATEFEARNAAGVVFSLPEQHAKNEIMATFLSWGLATNMIKSRDHATQALYMYGRRYPDHFIELFRKFVVAEDVYIRERLLSVAYAVVDGACKDGQQEGFVTQMITSVYSLFFQQGAALATSHILLRDYARQLIASGCRRYPELKGAVDLTRVYSNFETEGTLSWANDNSADSLDKEVERALFDYFFTKDHLRSLSKGDFYDKHDRFDLLKQQLFQRVRALGYELELFKDVDEQIRKWEGYNRDDVKVTERYGEKYVWIAYYELAGYLDDKGLLKDQWDEEGKPWRRFGDRFDPALPDQVEERMYFGKDILGDRTLPLQDWLAADNTPEIDELLLCSDVTADGEQYVLVDAHICQSEKESMRQLFCWINAVLAEPASLQDACAALTAHHINDVKPNYQEILYNSDYPHSDYFPSLAIKELECPVSEEKVSIPHCREAIFHEGQPLTSEMQNAFWQEMYKKYHFSRFGTREFVRQWEDEDGNLRGPVIIQYNSSKTPGNLDELLTQELQARNYILKMEYQDIEELEVVKKPVEVFLPSIQSKLGITVAKEIVQALGLNSRPGTTDLYDQQGKRASIAFRHGDKYNNNQRFLYFRKDLLEDFLVMKGYQLFWSFQGEWNWWREDAPAPHGDIPHWKQFATTIACA